MSAGVRRAVSALPAAAALGGIVLLAAPLVGLAARAPWREVPSRLASPSVRAAIELSLVCSLAATAASIALGFPIAWHLARSRAPGTSLLRALVTLPMVLPPVVGGIALLLAFGRRGPIGAWIESVTGAALPFTTLAVVIAETYVALPFFVLTAEAGIRALDPRFDEAAATLGAGPWTRLRRVTIPLLHPSLRAGAIVCWARALGEFGATITFAGNLPGRTQTLPLATYMAFETDPDAAIVLSLVLVAISFAVLWALRDRWWPRP